MIFGSRMKERRLALNITRSTLAYRLGVIGNTVYRWEKGERSPDHEMTSKIARELRTSISYLMGETNDPNRRTSTTKSIEDWRKDYAQNLCTKKNEKTLLGETELALPSGKIIQCDERSIQEFKLWEKDRSIERTIALAAVLGVPIVELVPLKISKEYPSDAHRRLDKLLKTIRTVDFENRYRIEIDIPEQKDLSENDAKYILATVLETVKWSIEKVKNEK